MKKDLVLTRQLQKLQKNKLQKLKVQGALKAQMVQNRLGQKEVLCADASGSMGGVKIERVREAICHIMPQRPGMRTVAFGSSVDEITVEDAHQLRSGGSTHMMEALVWAWEQEPSKIVLATDGEPTDASKDEILHEAVRHEVPICTLGIGHGDDDFDEDFLRELALRTGGTYDRVGDDVTALQQLEFKITLLLDHKSGKKSGGGAIQL